MCYYLPLLVFMFFSFCQTSPFMFTYIGRYLFCVGRQTKFALVERLFDSPSFHNMTHVTISIFYGNIDALFHVFVLYLYDLYRSFPVYFHFLPYHNKHDAILQRKQCVFPMNPFEKFLVKMVMLIPPSWLILIILRILQ